MVASTLRGVVCAAVLSFGLSANVRVVQTHLRAVKENATDKPWHDDLGKGDKMHEKHDIDTKEGQNNATTPYESIQSRVEKDLVENRLPNLTHACDGAYEKQLRCGPKEPWAAHTPFRPKVDSWMDQCKACKIRACNADLKMPDKEEGCRCAFQAKGDGFVADCVNTHAGMGDWKSCGAVRSCDKHGAGGQCVHNCWSMPSAMKATNPNVQIIDADEVSHVESVHEASIDQDADKEDDVEKEVEEERKEDNKKEGDDKKDKKDKKDKDDKDKKDKKGDKAFWKEARDGIKDAIPRSGAATNSASVAALVGLLYVATGF